MKIAILGGTGAIGATIAHHLETGHSKPLVLARHNFDISDPNLDVRNIGSPDVLIKCDGSFGGLRSYVKDQVTHDQNELNNRKKLYKYLNEHGCRLLINISSATAFNTKNALPDNPYASYYALKLQQEELIEKIFVNQILHLRPTNILSRFERFASSGHVVAALFRNIKAETSGNYQIWGHEEDWREFTYADDLANIVVNSIKQIFSYEPHCKSQIMGVSGNEKIPIKHLVSKIHNFIYGDKPYTINFTQPKRDGPLVNLLPKVIGNDFLYIQSDTDFDTALSNTLNYWTSIDISSNKSSVVRN